MFRKVIEEVKGYMSKKAEVVVESIQFCRDILNNKSYRITLGLTIMGVGIGVGGALIASAYIPTPNPA